MFFTADTHFGHDRTRILSRRPFDTVKEMDEAIIHRWNETIRGNDVVYHLGDFGNPKVIKELQGIIYLVPGNYDDQRTLDKLQEYRDTITIIQPNTQICLKSKDKTSVRLIHKPSEGIGKISDFFLFGHIHGLQKIKMNGLNVGVDCHHFYPIDAEDVEFYIDAIRKHYDGDVFCVECGKS